MAIEESLMWRYYLQVRAQIRTALENGTASEVAVVGQRGMWTFLVAHDPRLGLYTGLPTDAVGGSLEAFTDDQWSRIQEVVQDLIPEATTNLTIDDLKPRFAPPMVSDTDGKRWSLGPDGVLVRMEQ